MAQTIWLLLRHFSVADNDDATAAKQNGFTTHDWPIIFFKNAHFFVYFRSFQINNTIFTANLCEKIPNVHPVYGAGIQTHDLSNMSRHP